MNLKRRPCSPRRNLHLLDSLDEAEDSCASIAALAHLLRLDPSEVTHRVGTLLQREADKLQNSLLELTRHTRPKRKAGGFSKK